MSKYFGEYFGSREDVRLQFSAENIADFPTEDEILFAAYDTPPYEGYALVVYARDGVLYEVNGSHCSCNGLEGQWEPEATPRAALAMRQLDYGTEANARFKELFQS